MYKYIAVLFFPLTVFSQNKFNKDTVPDKISISPILLKNINKSAFETFVTAFSDSIDNAKISTELPLFLKNPDFDYYNTNFWFPGSKTISLRNIIISRVNNCASLKFIINENKLYKKKPNKGRNFKWGKNSFYDFAFRRYQLLNCE